MKKGKKALLVLYLAGFLYALKVAIPSYFNSSYVSSFTSDRIVGLIYTLGSIFTIVLLLFFPKILKRFSVYKTTVAILGIGMIATLGLAVFNNSIWLSIMFLVALVTTSVGYLCLDIFVENYSNDRSTGKIRSFYLTAINVGWVLAPTIAGYMLGVGENFWKLYMISTFISYLTLLLIYVSMKDFKEPDHEHVSIFKTLQKVYRDKNIYSVIGATFILQFFFAVMVIYTPIYLNKFIGFNLSDIGPIFTVMLLPFIIFQIPAGKLADKYFGEKEMLIIGFILMSLSTILIPFIGAKSLIIWGIILFMTRIGASVIEVLAESYFFKKICVDDTDIMGLFRMCGPLAYSLAPALASLFLVFFDMKFLFLTLGIVVLSGILFVARMKDTR